jgi:hypothetical protein
VDLYLVSNQRNKVIVIPDTTWFDIAVVAPLGSKHGDLPRELDSIPPLNLIRFMTRIDFAPSLGAQQEC